MRSLVRMVSPNGDELLVPLLAVGRWKARGWWRKGESPPPRRRRPKTKHAEPSEIDSGGFSLPDHDQEGD